MVQALQAGDRSSVASHHEPGAGLARVGPADAGPEPEVVWNEDRTRCLVMEGELYDTNSLREALAEHCRTDTRNHGDLLLCLYERFGEQALTRLNGAFAAAVWDRPSRELVLFNDRLGLHPLYYAQLGSGLLFGSGVRALLADAELNRTVDRVAINQFLVFDHLLDDRTLLTAVRLLPQGSVLRFREGQLEIRPYWQLHYPDFYEPRPEGEYVEQFMHVLRQAVSRQKPEQGRVGGVLLSGGLDSRLLLAVLADEQAPGSRLETFTFGIPGCDDARYAEEVARAIGTRHHFFELKPDWLLHLAQRAVSLTDGLGNIVNLHALATLEEESTFSRLIYKGFMGDALLGWALRRDMWGDYDAEGRFRVHLGAHTHHGVINYDRPQQHALFTDAFEQQVGDAVYQSYRSALHRSGSTQLANQRLYYDLTQRVPRMTINGVEVVRSRAVTRLPFCDNDLVDFVLTVPPGFLFDRYLAREGFVRSYSGLAQIPLAGPNRPPRSCVRDVLIQSRQLLAWHLGRAGLGWLNGVDRRPYKDYGRWFRTTLRPWVEDLLLGPRARDRGYFKPGRIGELVAQHMAGANHAGRLGALLTLELWHRHYLD